MEKHVVFDCDGTLIDTSRTTYELFDGIRNLIEELHTSHKLYVWTARDRASTLRILKDNSIFHFFEAIYTSDDNYPKPQSRGLGELLGDVEMKLVWVIGDSSHDILGARNYGARSIGACWNPMVTPTHLKQTGAEFVAMSPRDCLALIQKS